MNDIKNLEDLDSFIETLTQKQREQVGALVKSVTLRCKIKTALFMHGAPAECLRPLTEIKERGHITHEDFRVIQEYAPGFFKNPASLRKEIESRRISLNELAEKWIDCPI